MVISKPFSNKYFICKRGQEPILWNPLNTEKNIDPSCQYFGKVFEFMEKIVEANNLIIYLTWDINKLPSYGEDVVAVIQGDEWCRIPMYFHQVRAVFKCHSTSLILGSNPLLKPSYLNFLTLAQFLRTWCYRLPSLLNYFFYKSKIHQKGEFKTPSIYDIPLGYYNQSARPIKNIDERLYDVSFAGSVGQTCHSIWSLKRWLGTPKIISRKKMVRSVERLKQNYPEFKFQLSITPDSLSYATSEFAGETYSREMMDTKICLVPRGTNFETFRFFEALRYGCIVIAESLPSRWFYNGSPAIQVSDWEQLDQIVEDLISNKNLMKMKHEQSLTWWNQKCSEKAVGEYIANIINSLS